MPKTYFCLTLGPYDSEEAVETLPAQLEVLRNFADLRQPDVALVYRLQTVPEPEGDRAAQFRLLCVGAGDESLREAEAVSLWDQFSVALLPAWSLGHGHDEPPIPPGPWRAELQPVSERAWLPIKPDWAPLVDLVRMRPTAITVDLVCTAASDELDNATPATSPYAVVEAHHQLEAARFFAAAASAYGVDSVAPLTLRVLIHAAEPVDDVLARAVGRHLLGIPTHPVCIRRGLLFPTAGRRARIVGPPEMIVRSFHPPYGGMQGRGLSGARTTQLPITFRVPEAEGAVLGTAVRQTARFDRPVPVRLEHDDRLKHLYVLGKTGAGKTNFLKNVVRQDIEAGGGLAVIDPHGDLVDYALAHVGERIDDVLLLDFSDPEYLPAFNPLLLDVESATEHELMVEELLDVIIRRTFNQWTGPVFEDCVQMILDSIVSRPIRDLGVVPSLAAGIDVFRSPQGRKWVPTILRSTDPVLAGRWDTFNQMSGNEVAEHVRWVAAKFGDFAPAGVLFPVTSADEAGFSLDDVLEKGRILLLKMPEAVVGSRAAGFIGGLIFARLHRAALRRGGIEGRPFYLHIDEFQKFVSADIEGLVAEARKFRLGLTLAHQNLRQLDGFSRFEGSVSPRLREAIFSNVGTLVAMKVSGADVKVLAEELGLPERHVRRIGQYEALARSVVGGVEREPFTLAVSDARKWSGSARVATQVRQRMIKLGYWRRRNLLLERANASIDRLRTEWASTAPTRPFPVPPKTASPASTEPSAESSFLDEWNAKLGKHKVVQRPPDAADASDTEERNAMATRKVRA